MYIWLSFFLMTGYMYFIGLMLGSPLKKDYSASMEATNKLRYTSLTNLNIDIPNILSEYKKRIYTGMILDIGGTYMFSILYFTFCSSTLNKLFSNLYFQFPFYFPWFIIDFPPIGMVNKIGWISLSIIFSIFWSIIYSNLKTVGRSLHVN